MTFVVLFISTLPPFRFFPRKKVPWLQIVPLCILFNAFLVLGNLSLQYNDMAFYSLARLMTCPTVVLLNFILYRINSSRGTIYSIALLTLGVMVANGQFGLSNPIGATIAMLQFIATALYQISIGRRMKDLGVSPPQLLYNQAPLAVILLLPFIPIIDKRPDLGMYQSVHELSS